MVTTSRAYATLKPETIEEIDRLAAELDMPRSTFTAMLVHLGLRAYKKTQEFEYVLSSMQVEKLGLPADVHVGISEDGDQ